MIFVDHWPQALGIETIDSGLVNGGGEVAEKRTVIVRSLNFVVKNTRGSTNDTARTPQGHLIRVVRSCSIEIDQLPLTVFSTRRRKLYTLRIGRKQRS